MNIIEATVEMKKGKKMRRSNWSREDKYCYSEPQDGFIYDETDIYAYLTADDLEATDWVEYEGQIVYMFKSYESNYPLIFQTKEAALNHAKKVIEENYTNRHVPVHARDSSLEEFINEFELEWILFSRSEVGYVEITECRSLLRS